MAESIQIIDANTMIGAHRSHRLDASPERLIQDMDRHRIAASLTISTVGVAYNFVRGNTLTLEAAKTSSRLIPVATVNPKSYFGSATEMQAIRGQGFRIFRFYPTEQEWAIRSASFAKILEQLSPHKTPIMIEASRPGDPSEVARMTASYPGPVVLCSIGLDALTDTMAVMSDSPNILIGTDELYAPGALEMLSTRFGAGRIVFGSGAPTHSAASSLFHVLSSELSQDDKKLVLGGNIKRILEAA